jgi:hypothetical protein
VSTRLTGPNGSKNVDLRERTGSPNAAWWVCRNGILLTLKIPGESQKIFGESYDSNIGG